MNAQAQAVKYFPFCPVEIAEAQFAKLIKARRYLIEHNIAAVIPGSQFEYKSATGSVLRQQS